MADNYYDPEYPNINEQVDAMFERLWEQNARLEKQLTALQKKQQKLEWSGTE